MPSQQPDENMDQVLKAYAQKRRDDAPQMELDLVTRKMLQAEVARTLAPVPVEAKARPRFAWWPQIIMGVACLAALAIAVVLWLPSLSKAKSKAHQLASAPATPSVLTVSPSDVAIVETPKKTSAFYDLEKKEANTPALASPTGEFKFDSGITQGDTSLSYNVIAKDDVMVTNSVNVGNLTGSLDVLASREPAPALEQNRTASLSIAAPALTPAPAATTPSITAASPAQHGVVAGEALGGAIVANDRTQQVPQSNMRFSRIDNCAQYRRNLNSPPLPKVLTNFALQRYGSNISVRDADGSLYNGNIVIVGGVTESSRSRQLGIATAIGSAGTVQTSQDLNGEPEDTFAFRVSGYNGKLKQKIVFTGAVTNMLVVTNAIPSDSVQQNVVNAPASQNNSQQQQALKQNLLLNGKVQVGRGTEFDIQAAPTK